MSEPTLAGWIEYRHARYDAMTQSEIAEKIARARSQLYREAIANFMQTDTPDPRTVAEDRRLVQQLQNHAEHWHRIASSAPRN